MRVNQGYEILNYKSAIDEINKTIQKSSNEGFIRGLEKAKEIIKDNRVTQSDDLETKVKGYALDNKVSLDEAARIVIGGILKETPNTDLFRSLFDS